MATVLHVPAFADNYIWLLCVESTTHVAIVDPGDAQAVIAALEREDLEPIAVLCTHHHGDHVGGVRELAARYRMPVYGPAREHIPAMTHRLSEGDRVTLTPLGMTLEVLDVPGHTAGHIAYHGAGMLFCGDTLFSAGCGRLFEGTAQQLYGSLAKLAALPEDTAVYCAHEYTRANLQFALAVEPDNAAAQAYRREVEHRRGQGLPTLPSTIGLERRVNPFLRVREPAVRRAVERHYGGRAPSSEVEIFAALRRWKDGFRG